jgi:anti-sigma B factor antagonist
MNGSHADSERTDYRPDVNPTVEVRRPRAGVAHVVLGGEHDVSSAGDLKTTLDAALDGSSHLVVDLSAVEFIDSTTMRVLVGAKQAADEHERRFNLVLGGAAPGVQNALEITGVLALLNEVDTLEQALEADAGAGST